jgi:hypothetical protein
MRGVDRRCTRPNEGRGNEEHADGVDLTSVATVEVRDTLATLEGDRRRDLGQHRGQAMTGQDPRVIEDVTLEAGANLRPPRQEQSRPHRVEQVGQPNCRAV